jgi:16S rRNA (cytosine967-C5)-methyltransferase
MNTRKEALEILYQVFSKNGYASLIMREKKDIDPKHMPYISNVVYGVIRNYRFLEYQWRSYAKRTKLKTALTIDMAIYELFFMNGEDYAIVNEAVELVRDNEKKFVNAILRRVIQEGKKNSDDICIQYSHPEWIYHMWKAHYGEEITKKIMLADQQIPKVYGRINPLKITKEQLSQDTNVHFIDDYSFTMNQAIQNTEYFKEGKVLIQNPSSLLPVFSLDVKEGMRVLDTCAAPGTKTQMISALMNHTGEVIACDLYEQRCHLIDELMKRCGNTNVITKVNDATKETFVKESFDRILCDVPCSGLGDLSHKPEIRWHLKPENIDEIIQIQKEILNVSSSYLKKGGILVYSTCTLNKKENTSQINTFLKNHDDFILVEEKTIFPFETNHDGFYIAKLEKVH